MTRHYRCARISEQEIFAGGYQATTFASCHELDQKLGGARLPSTSDRVRLAVGLMPPVFSQAELESACTEISGRTVKRVLEELGADGRVEIAKRGKRRALAQDMTIDPAGAIPAIEDRRCSINSTSLIDRPLQHPHVLHPTPRVDSNDTTC